MKLINFRKIGTVLAVMIFGFISFTAGVDLTNKANSATSASVLPVNKGGTGANNAKGARTNLEVASTAEMDTAITDITDMKPAAPNKSTGESNPTYARLLNNIGEHTYQRLYKMDFAINEYQRYEDGTLTIRFLYSATANRTLNRADFCIEHDNYNGNYAPAPTYYVAVYKDANDVYSIWIKADKRALTYLRMFASKRALSIRESSLNYVPVPFDLQSRDGPPEGYELQDNWMEVARRCVLSPTPTASPGP
jgi:hypothetical protein